MKWLWALLVTFTLWYKCGPASPWEVFGVFDSYDEAAACSLFLIRHDYHDVAIAKDQLQ